MKIKKSMLKQIIKECIREEVINLHPGWNKLQVEIFNELQQQGFSYDFLINNMNAIGKLMRDYMDEKYPSAGWDIGNEQKSGIKNSLISKIKSNFLTVT